MNSKSIWKLVFTVYIVIYIMLFIFYGIFISLLHSSYSPQSLLGILLPFVILLLLHWALRKQNNESNEKKESKRWLLTLFLGFMPVLICMVLLGINEYKSNFTTEKWIEKPEERIIAVDDLLDNYTLVGMTTKEIRTLLGPSDDTTPYKESNIMVYYLGNERGLIKIDSETLILLFDDSEKITSYTIETD